VLVVHNFLEAFNVVHKKTTATVTIRIQCTLYCGHHGTTPHHDAFLRSAFLLSIPPHSPRSTPSERDDTAASGMSIRTYRRKCGHRIAL
jgi:hypothetical protein